MTFSETVLIALLTIVFMLCMSVLVSDPQHTQCIESGKTWACHQIGALEYGFVEQCRCAQ
jgi:hypothetical protein